MPFWGMVKWPPIGVWLLIAGSTVCTFVCLILIIIIIKYLFTWRHSLDILFTDLPNKDDRLVTQNYTRTSEQDTTLGLRVSQHHLTLSSLNLPLSPSSTTSRELLLQFSTSSGWRWLKVGDKWWKMILLLLKQFDKNVCSKRPRCSLLSHSS